MTFRKYPSIENHYYTGEIEKWLFHNPDLRDCMYSLQEKLHGANIQLHFEDGVMSIGKRTTMLLPGDKFYDIWNALEKIKDVTERLALLSRGGPSFTLYGELFGGSIGKGVNYGREQQIRFFDLRRGDEMVSALEFLKFAHDSRLDEFIVPLLATVEGIDEVLAYDENFLTRINPVEGNWAEGFVAKPLNKAFTSPQGAVFMIKKKAENFTEKQKAKREVIPDSGVAKLHAEMVSLATENRMLAIFSKEGKIDSPKQIGDYIKAFVTDCREELMKLHGELFDSLDRAQQKNVCRIGHLAVPILKRHL